MTENHEIDKLQKIESGYWKAKLDGISEKNRYSFITDEHRSRPDPSSFFKPLGVFGPSGIVDHSSLNGKIKSGEEGI